MSAPSVSLGYVGLYVKDVAATLAFYEEAFGLSRRFFNDDHGKAYGELETGAARLAFYSVELAKTQVKEFVAAATVKNAAQLADLIRQDDERIVDERASDRRNSAGRADERTQHPDRGRDGREAVAGFAFPRVVRVPDGRAGSAVDVKRAAKRPGR